MDIERAIDQVAGWIGAAGKVVVFTGAGVSTESGIPDFRSPGGLWDRYDPRDFYFQLFITSETAREKYWVMHSELYRMLKKVKPNLAHFACVELNRLDKLDCVITQNIDNLHQAAGLPSDKIIELHGNALTVSCLSCRHTVTREAVQHRLDASEKIPTCTECGGILKPDTIAFGQAMPADAMREAQYRSEHCDLFIVVGSSLVVQPAAFMPIYATNKGARLVIINLTETPYDHEAHVLIRGQAGQIMTKIMQTVTHKLTEPPGDPR